MGALTRVSRLRRRMTRPKTQPGPPPALSLSPAQEAGPDLPSREGIPDWVPQGKEDRWRNSVKVAEQLFSGNQEMVWQTSRTIFHDTDSYPD